jgi:hypothetical protein
MSDLAQTNMQLCRQLVANGWSDDDLRALRATYELAMLVFSAQFRSNGKTQLAHHVGVASALAAHDVGNEVVLAGLVHSTYFFGDFGDGRPGPFRENRRRLTAVVGAEVEELVHDYCQLEWTAAGIRALIAAPSPQPSRIRDLVAMRLANEIDEYTDAASRFTADEHPEGLDGDAGLALVGELAGRFGLEPMGEHVRRAAAVGAALPVPDVLVSTERHSVFVPPAAYRRRLHIALQDSRVGHAIAARVPGARKLATYIRARIT